MAAHETRWALAQERWRAALERLERVVDRRPIVIALIASALTTAVGATLTFRRATTPWSVLPDNDYWGNIRGLITEHGAVLDLDDLFRHNNEHIVVIPKLIYMANYLLTSGSNIGLIVYSICTGAACAILLLLLGRDLLRETPARWVFCAVLFPLAMFSAKLSHSYFFGMSGVIWLTADLFVILSAAALAKAASMKSTAWLLASLLAALLGVLAYSTAIYSLLLLFVFSAVLLLKPEIRGAIPRIALFGVVVVVMSVLAVWLAYRPHPAGHPPLDFDPIGLAAFVLIYMGGAISEGYWQPVMGVGIFAAVALAIWRLLAEGRGPDILLWVMLFLYAPFNSFMTAIGRLGFGIKAAMSSRYQSVAAISLIAGIALVLAALPKQDGSRRATRIRVGTIGTLAAIAVFLVVNDKTTKLYTKRTEPKPIAEIAWRLGLAGDQHIRAASHAMNQVLTVLPAVRAAHHVPFNTETRCEEFIGQHLPPGSGEPAGAVESMTTYTVSHETRTAIELTGWAVRAGRPAECIAVVDGTGIVIGAGVTASMRPEPLTQRSLRIGWQAVASAPQRPPVCAFALFPESTVWTPLANCPTEMGLWIR